MARDRKEGVYVGGEFIPYAGPVSLGAHVDDATGEELIVAGGKVVGSVEAVGSLIAQLHEKRALQHMRKAAAVQPSST